MPLQDYYKLLNVDRDAPIVEIEIAINNLMVAYNSLIESGVTGKIATHALKEIKAAKKALLNPNDRRSYDKQLAAGTDRMIEILPTRLNFDYSIHRVNDATSWRDLVDNPSVASVEIYRQILRQIIILPYPELQENIILATLLTPTPLAVTLPILFSQGEAGCGKSNIGKFAARIYGNTPMGATTTASAFARMLQEMKFDHRGVELPHMLVIDDVNLSILRSNQTIQQYLRSGFNRDTARVAKAKQDTDEEVEYSDIFGGRVISSCYPFYSDPDFAEIARRMLVIECRKSDRAIEVVDPDLINWEGFEDVRARLWETDSSMCAKYTQNRKQITSYAVRNNFTRPDKIALGKDVLATGMTLGLWGTAAEALSEYELFLDSQEQLVRDKGDIVERMVKRFSDETIAECVDTGMTPCLQTTALKQITEMYVATGVFDNHIRTTHVNGIVRRLGWYMCETRKNWYRSDSKRN
jgi:hypothetical protein